MKRWLIAAAAAAMSMAVVPVGAAAGGESNHFGPFESASADGGSCGAPWALDTFNRFFKVHDNGDGTFLVREDYKDGKFVTIGPRSPGGCEAGSDHGTAVVPGVMGRFHGYLSGTVTGGTYDPDGCEVAGAACDSTAGFIKATFGAGGTYNVSSFAFEYSAGGQELIYHHWVDRSASDGSEVFMGDIATS